MGSLANSPNLAAFSNQIHKKGLDLGRCVIGTDLGTHVALSSATIRAGQIVTRTAAGYVDAATGNDTFGVSKWNKQQFGVSVVVDEPVVLNGTAASSLSRGNISNLVVRSATGMSGTVYTGAGGDYNENLTNGTIARDATTTITDGQTVYASFTYALTDDDFEFDGRDFRNQSNNDVQGSEGRLAVITDWALLFDIEWDSGETYALTGATSNLYCSAEGKFTNQQTAAEDFVGKVFQLPTADDPYMGITMHGNPVEQ